MKNYLFISFFTICIAIISFNSYAAYVIPINSPCKDHFNFDEQSYCEAQRTSNKNYCYNINDFNLKQSCLNNFK